MTTKKQKALRPAVERGIWVKCTADAIESVARCFRAGTDLNGAPFSPAQAADCLRHLADTIEEKADELEGR